MSKHIYRNLKGGSQLLVCEYKVLDKGCNIHLLGSNLL